MKNLHTLFLIIVTSLITASCVYDVNWTGAEEGSQKIVTKKIELDDFTKIILKGSSNIEINQGGKCLAELEIDDNLVEFIEFEINKTTLIISSKSSISPSVYNIVLTMPSVEAIGVNGSGDIKCNMLAGSPLLRLRINGSGTIELEAKSDKVKAHINGSGDIILSGQSGELNATINGSGDLEASACIVENVNVSIRGSGDAQVNAVNKLDVEIFGSGDVGYLSKPKVLKQSVYGSGSVKLLPEDSPHGK